MLVIVILNSFENSENFLYCLGCRYFKVLSLIYFKNFFLVNLVKYKANDQKQFYINFRTMKYLHQNK